MTITHITQPVHVTIWEGCVGTEKIVLLPNTAKRVAVTIPPGIRSGQKIRIHDYYSTYLIPVNLQEDGVHNLARDGTLNRELIVDPTSLKVGGKIQLTTPYGNIALDVPPNTSDGTHWTIKGWGYPKRPGTSAKADLIITARGESSAHFATLNREANTYRRTKTPDDTAADQNPALSLLQAILGLASVLNQSQGEMRRKMG